MKMLIAGVLIALMCAASALIVKKIKGVPTKKNKEDASVLASESGTATTQEFVSIAGFDGPCAITCDGTRVIFIGVTGKNLSFATALERDADAEGLSIALASIRRAYRIHRCLRPIDQTVPIKHLRDQISAIDEEVAKIRAGEAHLFGFAAEKAISAHLARRALIEEIYLPQLSSQSAPKYETDIYLTCGFEEAKGVAARATEEANAIITQLAAAGYAAKILTPKEVIERLTNYWGRFPVKAENDDPYSAHAVEHAA